MALCSLPASSPAVLSPVFALSRRFLPLGLRYLIAMSRRRSLAVATISAVPLTTVLLFTLILLLAAPPVSSSSAQVQLHASTSPSTLPEGLVLQPDLGAGDSERAMEEGFVPRGEDEVEALDFAEDLAKLEEDGAAASEPSGPQGALNDEHDENEAAAPLSILTLVFLDADHTEDMPTSRTHKNLVSPSSIPSPSAVVPSGRSATALPVFVVPSSDPLTSGVISLLCKTVSYTLALTVFAVFVFLYSGPSL